MTWLGNLRSFRSESPHSDDKDFYEWDSTRGRGSHPNSVHNASVIKILKPLLLLTLMMKPDFDVAVVGAGPAGCIAAETTAKQGLRTVIFERRKQVGIPVQCGEFLPTPSEMLDLLPDCPRVSRLVDVPKRFITNETHNLKVVSPENSVFNFFKVF